MRLKSNDHRLQVSFIIQDSYRTLPNTKETVVNAKSLLLDSNKKDNKLALCKRDMNHSFSEKKTR
jgi:hypothetical protein